VSAERNVEVISAADIPDRADTDEQFIQAVVRRSQSADPNGRFEQRLARLASGLQRLADESHGTGQSTLSLGTLGTLLRHWQFYERQISRWRIDYQRFTKSRLEDATGMATRRAVWQATATRLAATDSAGVLLQPVDELIGHIDQANKALSLSLATALDLGRRGNALQSQVESGSAAVLDRIAEQDRRLLVIDSPPLWQARRAARRRASGYARACKSIWHSGGTMTLRMSRRCG
jgi:hypothetical protein